uniref:Myb/SANT-like DNA-binding domain-containing protein n=1 Tax=Leersia perrieri TaxID=77586 RepID=A0A0D9W5I1_9ORYZ
MEEDDAASSSPSMSLPVADPVTVAAAGPPAASGLLALALPIQKQQGGSSGREDAWSEGATAALIEAWGERFVALGRGSLRHPQWQEVADAVSSREGYTKAPKSDVQCKNRIDTLKKKYKVERNKAAPSSWKVPPSPEPEPELSDSESSDGFPPEREPAIPFMPPNGKRSRVDDGDGDRAQGLRDLAQAIRRFGEAYERVETAKLEQAAEMERRRLDFASELESQRVQFFVNTQMELSQVKNHSYSSPANAAAPPAAAAGGSSRRMASVNDAGGNYHRRYRVSESSRHRHHPPPRPHYQYHENKVAAVTAAAAAAASDGEQTDDEEDEDEDEESQ